MKYIVVGYLGKYGSMGQWVSDCLKLMGNDVVEVDRWSPIPVEKAIYFFIDSSEDYSTNIPDIPYPKVFWSMDAHMPGGLERAKNIASKCDLVISSNYEYGVKLLETVGIKSFLLPITYRSDYFDVPYTDLSDRKYDVVMIGHPNSPQRQELWNILGKYNSFCGVADTLSGYRNAMTQAKIVVNQPTEPWDIIINNRFFEALGVGSVLLQKKLKTEIIEKIGFEANKDFLYWNNLSEIEPMIDVILKDINKYKYLTYDSQNKVLKYEMVEQLKKIESLILNDFYDYI